METRMLLHTCELGKTASTSKMKIIDLNIDCLEKICQYLEVADLLNVADSNKCLKGAAELIFKLKHSKKTVEIHGAHYRVEDIIDSEHSLMIYDLISSLRIVRCFGHLVTNLKITVDRTDYLYKVYADRFCHSFHCLITYVNQYSAESLVQFTLSTNQEIPDKALNHLKKPFLNVEKLYIVQFPNLERSLINKLFPRVRHLVYADAPYFTDFARIENHFRHLSHLHLNISSVKYRYTSIKCEEKSAQICSFLRLNPQLVSLTLPFILDMKLFQCISELSSLKTLKLYNFWGRISNYDDNPIHLKHLKRLKIDEFYECPQIPLTFDHLEELRIFCQHFCNNFHQFLIENPTIRKITSSPKILKDEHLSKLANALPFLEEIDVRDLSTTSNDVINAINGLKSLRKISFNFKQRSNEYAELQTHLNRKWKSFTKFTPKDGQWIECVRDMD